MRVLSGFFGAARLSLAGLGCFGAQLLSASPVLFDSAADLLIHAPDTHFENFEVLEKDNRASQHDGFSLEGFDVLASAKKLGVYNRKSAGQAATDGQQYIKYSPEPGGSTLTFNFPSPVNTFGVSVIDWGERGVGELSLLASGVGVVHGLQTPQLDSGVAFLGVQLTSPVDSLQLMHDLSSESWAFDGVYYGFDARAHQAGFDNQTTSMAAENSVDVSEPGALFLVGLACLWLRRGVQ